VSKLMQRFYNMQHLRQIKYRDFLLDMIKIGMDMIILAEMFIL